MISLTKIMREILSEISFKTLLGISEPGRVDRAKHVSTKSLRVGTIDDKELWTFSYKSQGNHSTTGNRWNGYIKFEKQEVSIKDNAEDLNCRVSCDCPDYKFRYAYNNHKEDAGDLGTNNGQPPRSRAQGGVGNYGVGLCKHLIALANYLKTSIEAPEPEDEAPEPMVVKPAAKVTPPTPSTPQTTQAPDPDEKEIDTYSDSRGLEENKISNLYNRFQQFVNTHKEFEVPYE